ncbi:DUF4411 family protein [Fictibacillus terranigra]|uniref:DUF4411 family protein n=1 Tax=Fictibacillus terranigra TaxID=3058424 RepID=A0ABT8EBZ9_9BACL|nr:DUF4411 family protein [Fictibacillus sp. CENA-BCM004]MDN4075446.1 DUF4411 family protein [Fictibacillus sp. CENA-BCM004]
MSPLSLLLDTNVLRYRAHEGNQYKVMSFWNLIRSYPNHIDLFISKTTEQELQVQSHLLPEKEVKKINRFLQIIDVLNCEATDQQVHETRDISSYIAVKYQLKRSHSPTKRIDVPSTNDAKILLAAHIVTRNVKDFVLYSCKFFRYVMV